MLNNLARYKLVLGSRSPRRRELFDKLRLPYTIRTSDVEEIIPKDYDIMAAATYLAKLKADDLRPSMADDELLITADTVVIADGLILGKPKDRDDALQTILSLSGCRHLVVTGVCITTYDQQVTFDDVTEVTFAEVSREEAEWYVDHCQVMDKAGSYGIQDWIGLTKVAHINGSYYNIMGLPVHRLYKEFINMY